MDKNEDPQLSRALHSWKVGGALPPRFQEEVWARLALEGARVPWWQYWIEAVTTALPRPAIAISYVLLLLFVGAGAGWWHGRAQASRLDQHLGRLYVEAIDPYQKPH